MIKNIKCCHLLQNNVNYCTKFGPEVKMKIQITIARNGHFKSLYCLYVLPSVDKNHNYSSKIWDWSKVSTTKHLCKKLVTLKKVLSAAICWKKIINLASVDEWKTVDGSARISNFQFVDGYPLAVANARREFPLLKELCSHVLKYLVVLFTFENLLTVLA